MSSQLSEYTRKTGLLLKAMRTATAQTQVLKDAYQARLVAIEREREEAKDHLSQEAFLAQSTRLDKRCGEALAEYLEKNAEVLRGVRAVREYCASCSNIPEDGVIQTPAVSTTENSGDSQPSHSVELRDRNEQPVASSSQGEADTSSSGSIAETIDEPRSTVIGSVPVVSREVSPSINLGTFEGSTPIGNLFILRLLPFACKVLPTEPNLAPGQDQRSKKPHSTTVNSALSSRPSLEHASLKTEAQNFQFAFKYQAGDVIQGMGPSQNPHVSALTSSRSHWSLKMMENLSYKFTFQSGDALLGKKRDAVHVTPSALVDLDKESTLRIAHTPDHDTPAAQKSDERGEPMVQPQLGPVLHHQQYTESKSSSTDVKKNYNLTDLLSMVLLALKNFVNGGVALAPKLSTMPAAIVTEAEDGVDSETAVEG